MDKINRVKRVSIYNLVNDKKNMPYLNETVYKDYEYEDEELTFNSDREGVLLLCEILKAHLLHIENEYLATYDIDGKLIGFFHIGIGDITSVNHSIRTIATYILLSGAFSFRLFHNHPLGEKIPSQGDKNSSFCYNHLAITLGVEYKGSYIISRTGYTNVDTGEQNDFDDIDYEWINNDIV